MKIFDRPFFKTTPLGRTLSGRNKTGQALGVVKDTVLALTPFKSIDRANGHITKLSEIAGTGLDIRELNLSEKTIKIIRFAVLAVIFAAITLGVIAPEAGAMLLEYASQIGIFGFVIAGFAAQQGQFYRIVGPADPRPKIFGQGPEPDRYISMIDDLEVVDVIGDVVTASVHVPYPRGQSQFHRHVNWINEHPNRFELVEEEEDQNED